MKNKFYKNFLSLSLSILILSSMIGCAKEEVKKQTDSVKVSSSTAVAEVSATPTQTPKTEGFQNQDKKRVKAKGLYLTGTSAGSKLKSYIELTKTTGINTYVIDYKDDGEDKDSNGNIINVKAKSEVQFAKDAKAIANEYDAEKVVKDLHDNGIYAIARIVVFKDPAFAKLKQETAIKNKDGSIFIHNKVPWVSAYSKTVWQYNIDLAKEALSKGFDEVQFDYIRFPDITKSQSEKIDFPENDGKTRIETINAFLAEARKQLPTAIISGDIFAIVIESESDGKALGQEFETVGENLDYVCPMAYPSHYNNGQIINNVKFPTPDLDPYGIIYQTLLKAKSKQEKITKHKPIIRTYIQDFTASWIKNYQKYGEPQVEQQIKAITDAGYEEFLVWDPNNNYSSNAIKK